MLVKSWACRAWYFVRSGPTLLLLQAHLAKCHLNKLTSHIFNQHYRVGRKIPLITPCLTEYLITDGTVNAFFLTKVNIHRRLGVP